MEGFSDEELRRLCYDTPELHLVHDELASVTGKAALVDILLKHAERQLQFETLLELAQQRNPEWYAHHGPYRSIP